MQFNKQIQTPLKNMLWKLNEANGESPVHHDVPNEYKNNQTRYHVCDT